MIAAMDESFSKYITPEGLSYSPSSSPPGASNDSMRLSLDEAKLKILQCCQLYSLSSNRPIMTLKNLRLAYKVCNGRILDEQELQRLFSNSDLIAIITYHFPELTLTRLANGDCQIFMDQYTLDETIDKLNAVTKCQDRSPLNADANESGYSGSGESNNPSRPASVMSTTTSLSKVCPLRSLVPNLTNIFKTPEEVTAAYSELRQDRAVRKAEFQKYINKKRAELNAMKKAEIAATVNHQVAAIVKKYDQLMRDFENSINQRLEKIAALEADDDAFFEAQLKKFHMYPSNPCLLS